MLRQLDTEDTVSPTNPFDIFPIELMVLIFSELKSKDLQRIKAVCSLWRALATDVEEMQINQQIRSFKDSTLWQYISVISDDGDITAYVKQRSILSHIKAPMRFSEFCYKPFGRNFEKYSQHTYWKNCLSATAIAQRTRHLLHIHKMYPVTSPKISSDFLRLPNHAKKAQRELLETYQELEAAFAMLDLVRNVLVQTPIPSLDQTLDMLCNPKFKYITGEALVFLDRTFTFYYKSRTHKVVDSLIYTVFARSIQAYKSTSTVQNKYSMLLNKLSPEDWLTYLQWNARGFHNQRYTQFIQAIECEHPIIKKNIDADIVHAILEVFKRQGGPDFSGILLSPIALRFIRDEMLIQLMLAASNELLHKITINNPDFLKRFDIPLIEKIKSRKDNDVMKFFLAANDRLWTHIISVDPGFIKRFNGALIQKLLHVDTDGNIAKQLSQWGLSLVVASPETDSSSVKILVKLDKRTTKTLSQLSEQHQPISTQIAEDTKPVSSTQGIFHRRKKSDQRPTPDKKRSCRIM